MEMFAATVLLLLATIAISVTAPNPECFQTFDDWKKIWEPVEKYSQRINYRENCKRVENHNKNTGITNSFRLILNMFADKKIANFANPSALPTTSICQKTRQETRVQNDTFDWRLENPLIKESKVFDQKHCSSCYAVVAVGMVHAWYAIHYRQHKSLSVWNVVQCAKSKCKSGEVHEALIHLKNYGNVSEHVSAYLNDSAICSQRANTMLDFNFSKVNDTSVEGLKRALRTHGPIAIEIYAELPTFRFYDSGIFEDARCNNNKSDHGVLLVGYGFDPELKKRFWIIKNSWNEKWGEKGYMRLTQDCEKNCLRPSNAYHLVAPSLFPVTTKIQRYPMDKTVVKKFPSIPLKNSTVQSKPGFKMIRFGKGSRASITNDTSFSVFCISLIIFTANMCCVIFN